MTWSCKALWCMGFALSTDPHIDTKHHYNPRNPEIHALFCTGTNWVNEVLANMLISYLLQDTDFGVFINSQGNTVKNFCFSGHAFLPVHGPFVFLHPGLQGDVDSGTATSQAA